MGTLYIVATPIGNLKDITFRTIEVLSKVDYVLCEDTRITKKLLSHYDIRKQVQSFNEFNEPLKMRQVLADLASGKNIALVSDAGSPLISDPGYKLARESLLKGIKLESVPGASALIVALTVSGLPPDKFLFLGYLPKKDGKRRTLLSKVFQLLNSIKMTIIFYESPYRLLKTLEDIKGIFGDIDIVVCRELTKVYEEVRREKVSQSIDYFSKFEPKGEFTLLF